MDAPKGLYESIALAIGEKIKERREDLGLNQSELGRSVYLSQQTISHYETGRTVPDAVTLWMIAKGLNCRVQDLWN